MSTEESKKVDKEVSLTRRAALKAGWAVPIIVAIGLGGNTFVHATPRGKAIGKPITPGDDKGNKKGWM